VLAIWLRKKGIAVRIIDEILRFEWNEEVKAKIKGLMRDVIYLLLPDVHISFMSKAQNLSVLQNYLISKLGLKFILAKVE
jgi:hypothetical protein